MAPAAAVVDLEDYVKAWAWQMFEAVRGKDEHKLTKEQLEMEIIWKKVTFQHDEPIFKDKQMPKEPVGQVVFTTTFVNDTAGDHEYSFVTERRTKSTCAVEMFRGVTTGTQVELTLKTPCEVLEMNTEFSREVEVSKTVGEVLEKEMLWCVDSLIRLPPYTKTNAKLIVNQQEFSSKFTVTTKFWGRVIVNFYNRKDNNNFVRNVEGFVEEIFRGREGFTIDKKVVVYKSEGNCNFRFGIDQRVELNQLPIGEKNNNA